MFLIDDLLLAPVNGFKFILGQIQKMADQELNDDTIIKVCAPTQQAPAVGDLALSLMEGVGRSDFQDRLAQSLGRRGRARGLNGVEQDAQRHRADDDERVHRVARPRRDAARREQDEHERARQLRHDVAREADAHRARELVRSGGHEAAPRLDLREPARGRWARGRGGGVWQREWCGHAPSRVRGAPGAGHRTEGKIRLTEASAHQASPDAEPSAPRLRFR